VDICKWYLGCGYKVHIHIFYLEEVVGKFRQLTRAG
jgi:hypothetical protein